VLAATPQRESRRILTEWSPCAGRRHELRIINTIYALHCNRHFWSGHFDHQGIVSRRRNYTYPAGFTNVQSYLDAQGARAVVHFETDSAESILRYTADWPEVALDIFPVVPSERAWEAYLDRTH